MLRSLVAASALALALAAAPLAHAQEEAIYDSIETIHGDADGFFEVYGQITDAMLFDNPAGIADNAAYPLPINANGESYDVLEAQDVIDNFDALLSPDTRAALGNQDVADLIVTSEGVGLAGGVMWVTNICVDGDACTQTEWKIVSINN